MQHGYYGGPIDGEEGDVTRTALRAFQSEHGLLADGIAGPRTGNALGWRELGSRLLARGSRGWDIAELQFLLAWHGFPSGQFDGRFGDHLDGALRRFQRFAGLPPDGIAGSACLAALRLPPPRIPIVLAAPIDAPVGDVYGPRGKRFHEGVDYTAEAGMPVRAAAAGRVTWVGDRAGWGLLVTVAHGRGVRTLYAHLSADRVRLGEVVAAGETVGLVGSTGDATGPHLHFEVRVAGAAVDPLPGIR